MVVPKVQELLYTKQSRQTAYLRPVPIWHDIQKSTSFYICFDSIVPKHSVLRVIQRLDKDSNSGGARRVKIPKNAWF